MATSRLDRLAPLSGLVSTVLVLIGFGVLGGNTPSTDDPAAKVVAYYHDHYGRQVAAAVVVAVAAMFLIWFAATLATELRRRRGATAAYGGLLVVAVGLLIQSSVHIALADAGHHRLPQVAQTLGVLDGYTFLPVVAGLFIALSAVAVAALRRAEFPAWVGWSAAVVAIALVSPAGFFATIAAIVWLGALGVSMYVRDGGAGSPEAVAVRAQALAQQPGG
jgi:hypothetical protein